MPHTRSTMRSGGRMPSSVTRSPGLGSARACSVVLVEETFPKVTRIVAETLVPSSEGSRQPSSRSICFLRLLTVPLAGRDFVSRARVARSSLAAPVQVSQPKEREQPHRAYLVVVRSSV